MTAPVEQIVTTGVTFTTSVTNIFIGWASATVGDKTTIIPTSTGSLTTIVVQDLVGNAATYPITILPESGGIYGTSQIYTDYNASLTFLDTSVGWCSI